MFEIVITAAATRVEAIRQGIRHYFKEPFEGNEGIAAGEHHSTRKHTNEQRYVNLFECKRNNNGD